MTRKAITRRLGPCATNSAANLQHENEGAGFRVRAFFSSRANFSLFAELDLDRGGRLRTATKV